MPATLQTTRLPSDLLKFLKEIKKNNNKDWFTTNKSRYEESLKAPCLAFVASVGPALQEISKTTVADPRPVGGSLSRIYRDIRFSKDKSPYKTNVGLMFHNWHNDETTHLPGFYLHLEPGDSGVWAGVWQPPPPLLQSIRDRIVAKPEEWKKVTKGHEWADHGESLKRVPSGYDAAHPFAEDLKRKDFLVGTSFTDAQVTSADFKSTFLEACKDLASFNAFLSKAMGTDW